MAFRGIGFPDRIMGYRERRRTLGLLPVVLAVQVDRDAEE